MNIERTIRKIYATKPYRVGLHLLFWILLSFVQWYLSDISFSPYKSFPTSIMILGQVSTTMSTMLFYYPFVYFVLPLLVKRRRWPGAILSVLLLAILYGVFDTVREKFILSPCASCMTALKNANIGYYEFLQLSLPNRLFGKLVSMGTFISLLFSIALPLSIKLGLQTLRQQFRSMQLAKENLQLEFDFLRSQVNPHFLFNSLNNIYGLILNDEKNKSADLVARLSHFLRYTLYESGSDKVAVEKEIQLLKDYIDLESIRLNYTNVKFTCTTDGSISSMPPLLMVPVVENAFKYCADNKEASIDIRLQIKNKVLHFQSKNTVDPDRQSSVAGGIGINNFRKRLQLYYPGVHQYAATSSEQEYVVTINIDAHE